METSALMQPCSRSQKKLFPKVCALLWFVILSYLRPMANDTVLQLEIPGIRKLKSGKVREIFDLGDSFLFVASDRISAFDVVMPNGIPRKGEVLTQLSYFWFSQTESFQPNHLISKAGDPLPDKLKPFADKLERRSMVVKKAQPLA